LAKLSLNVLGEVNMPLGRSWGATGSPEPPLFKGKPPKLKYEPPWLKGDPQCKVSLNGSRVSFHAFRVNFHNSRVSSMAQGEPPTLFCENRPSWGYFTHLVLTTSNIYMYLIKNIFQLESE
jgi:hypothetical protein